METIKIGDQVWSLNNSTINLMMKFLHLSMNQLKVEKSSQLNN